jgi:hypothetical protein
MDLRRLANLFCETYETRTSAMRFVTFLAATTLLMTATPKATAQSAAEGFLRSFQNEGSAERFRRNVSLDKGVNNGFGAEASRPDTGPQAPRPALRAPLRSPSTPIATPAGPPRRQSASFGVGTAGGGSKPFSHVTPQPTISPYLGLFEQGFGEFDDLNYQTIVRPRIQQQQFNQQVMQQAQTVNRRLSALSARNAYNTTGNEQVMPTGHAATFQYYSRFYPQRGQQTGRRR